MTDKAVKIKDEYIHPAIERQYFKDIDTYESLPK